jgi:hypothetical protein
MSRVLKQCSLILIWCLDPFSFLAFVMPKVVSRSAVSSSTDGTVYPCFVF